MSKRPASDISTDSNKKTRTDETSTGPFDKESAMLESLKKEMDSLLDQANEHHEEVRIAAVDTAFDLEEKLKERGFSILHPQKPNSQKTITQNIK